MPQESEKKFFINFVNFHQPGTPALHHFLSDLCSLDVDVMVCAVTEYKQSIYSDEGLIPEKASLIIKYTTEKQFAWLKFFTLLFQGATNNPTPKD